jgi:hypothetical protein
MKGARAILFGPIIACLGSVANRGVWWNIDERGREQQDGWRADRTPFIIILPDGTALFIGRFVPENGEPQPLPRRLSGSS